MQNRAPLAIAIAALSIAAVVAVIVMLRSAAWSPDLGMIPFAFWAISPYACIFAVCVLIEKFTSLPYLRIILCIISILMLVFTLMAYLGTMEDDSSTYALIFLFVPVLLYAGGLSLLLFGVLVAWLSKRRQTNV